MDFLDFMHVMLDLQTKFPGMYWEPTVTMGGCAVVVSLPVTDETLEHLRGAREMFAHGL